MQVPVSADGAPLRECADEGAVQWINVGFRPEVVQEINVWAAITHELYRQVFVHCEHRGALLSRARCRLLQFLAAADLWCRCHTQSRIAERVCDAALVLFACGLLLLLHSFTLQRLYRTSTHTNTHDTHIHART